MSTYQRLLAGLLCLVGLSGCGSSSNVLLPPIAVPPIARVATYLVAADRDGELNVFNVDTSNGNIAQVPGSPFDAGSPLITVAVHPNGRLLFGGTQGASLLEGFSLDPATGALTALPGYPIATVPNGAAIFDATGEFLYVVGTSEIDAFRVDPGTGNPARVAGFPIVVTGLGDALHPEISPDNRFLFLSDRDNDQIFSLAINGQTGALTVVDQTASNSLEPTAIGLTPDGRFLYVAHTDGVLTGFEVETDGTLTPLAGMAAFATAPALTYRMDFFADTLYVADLISDTLSAFEVGPNGELTPVAGYPVVGGGGGVLVYPFPIGDYLYLSDGTDGAIEGFSINANSSLTPVPGSPFTGLGLVTDLEAAIVSF